MKELRQKTVVMGQCWHPLKRVSLRNLIRVSNRRKSADSLSFLPFSWSSPRPLSRDSGLPHLREGLSVASLWSSLPFGLLVELARVFWNSFLIFVGYVSPWNPVGACRDYSSLMSAIGTWQGIAPCDPQARFNRYRSLTKSSKSRFEWFNWLDDFPG